MKDLKYFIEQEKEFVQQYGKVPECVYDKEYGEFGYVTKPTEFLRDEPFSKYSQLAVDKNKYYYAKEFKLSDLEFVILQLYFTKYSMYFRDDYYTEYIPQIALDIQEILEGILLKSPKNTAKILYRFWKEEKIDLKQGDIYEPQYCLTATIDDWEFDGHVFEITPLNENETNAYELFRLIKNQNENQVSFLKGTKFRVIDIQETEKIKRYFLEEMK